MPSGTLGQEITFASQIDPDSKSAEYVWVRAQKDDTIKKIASRRGHPEMASEILSLNKRLKLKNGHYCRSVWQVLRTGDRVRLPGTLKQGDSFSVTCGDSRPLVKDGYAKYDTVDRPGRVGLNRFLGYNPIAIDISILFDTYPTDDGTSVEQRIAMLERMAGRGDYAGAADGPPAVIRVSVTDNRGRIVPLVPTNYQWTPSNPNAPLYRISNIAWADGALSDDSGRRTRQAAVVTVTQYTPLILLKRSATQRAKSRKKK